MLVRLSAMCPDFHCRSEGREGIVEVNMPLSLTSPKGHLNWEGLFSVTNPSQGLISLTLRVADKYQRKHKIALVLVWM